MLIFLIASVSALCPCNSGICANNTCFCPSPSVGPQCDYQIQYQYGMNHTSSIEEYLGNPQQNMCQNNGQLINQTCYCPSPYGGAQCQIKVELMQPPIHSVKSLVQKGQQAPQPEPGMPYFDEKALLKAKCEIPCRNGGYCVYGMCMCKSPYVGDYCQYTIKFEYGTPHYQAAMACIFCFLCGFALVFILFLLKKMKDTANKRYELLTGENKDEFKKK